MSEQASIAVRRWTLPAVDGPIIGVPRTKEKEKEEEEDRAEKLRAEEEAARARGHQAGYEAGYQAGYSEGLAAAQAEMQPRIAQLDERIRHLDAILSLLARPLEELDSAVEHELVQLALAVGKQLARRELTVDPSQVIAIIRESLERLPVQTREVRVELHPQDAAVIRERLAAPATDKAWSIVENPTLSRGGCLVHAESSHVDARLESRVAAVIAAVLGEERTPERAAASPSAGRSEDDE